MSRAGQEPSVTNVIVENMRKLKIHSDTFVFACVSEHPACFLGFFGASCDKVSVRLVCHVVMRRGIVDALLNSESSEKSKKQQGKYILTK